MKAIQTRYAGHHFRSRLEARWAVFFDTVGIRWEYEHQGYMCPYELTPEREGEFPYLPDFWLPELNMFAEVKGSTESGELWKVLHSAAHFSKNGNDLLFLGHIPHPDRFRVPYLLHWNNGYLSGKPWVMDCPDPRLPCWIWRIVDSGEILDCSADEAWEMLLHMTNPVNSRGPFCSREHEQVWFHAVADSRHPFERGYEEARSARF